MKYIVYLTTNLVNKKIYIGVHKTENPDVFDGYIGNGVYINQPYSYNHHMTPFKYAVKKYGCKNFFRKTIKVFDIKEDAYKLEEELVNQDFLKRSDVYNICLGGDGSPEYSPIYQFDLDGNYLKEWPNMIEAAEFFGISGTAISNAIRFKSASAKFFWSKETKINISEYHQPISGTICYCYDSSSRKLINIYNSMTEASKALNIHIVSIQKAMACGVKAGNYYFSPKLLDEFIVRPTVKLNSVTLYVYTLAGEYIKALTSVSEMLDFFNMKNTCNIQKALKSGRPCKGYQISTEKVDFLSPVEDKRNIKKRIAKYSITGELIKEYNSITEAQKENGYGLKQCLLGKVQTYKNYIYKYIKSQ